MGYFNWFCISKVDHVCVQSYEPIVGFGKQGHFNILTIFALTTWEGDTRQLYAQKLAMPCVGNLMQLQLFGCKLGEKFVKLSR